MNPDSIETQPERSAADYRTTTAETETKTRTVQEPAACYTAAPASEYLLTISPAASRLELAFEDAKKYPRRCTRWYYREELANKGALETMLDEYHSVKLLAIALNCSEYMVYRAIRHHGITYPRAYPSMKAKELLQL